MNIPPYWHAERWNGALHQFRMWVTHVQSSMYDCFFPRWYRVAGLVQLILSFYKYCFYFSFFTHSHKCVSESVYLASSYQTVFVVVSEQSGGRWSGLAFLQCRAAHVSFWLYNSAGQLPLNPQQRLNQAYQEQAAQCWNTTQSHDHTR